VAIAGFFLVLMGFTVYRNDGRTIQRRARPGWPSAGSCRHFQDVAGVDEAKTSSRKRRVLRPERFSSLGGRIPKGSPHRPPGTGKTLLARSIAVKRASRSSSRAADFVEVCRRRRGARARLSRTPAGHKSCIIFIDRADAVGRNRGGNSLTTKNASRR